MRISDWSSDVCSSDLPGPGGAGDAIITIEIKPHPFFERDGNNVRLNLPVTLDEAVNGARVKVPTVDGPVMLGIPAGSSSGKTLRLKGKGFHDRMGARGDQLVTLMLDVTADDARLTSFLPDWRDGRAVRDNLGGCWQTAVALVLQKGTL